MHSWHTGNLPEATSLGNTDSAISSSRQLSITPQLGVRVCVLPHYAGMLIGLICADPVWSQLVWVPQVCWDFILLFIYWLILYGFIDVLALGIEPSILHLLCKYSIMELCPQPNIDLFGLLRGEFPCVDHAGLELILSLLPLLPCKYRHGPPPWAAEHRT